MVESLRPSADRYFLAIARVVATRATCSRRFVGCVLVDEYKHILATGYNGLSAGEKHCTEHPCEFAHGKSGTPCNAIHAEINALIQCTQPQSIHTIYCTASPCIHCTRALLNTPAKRIVFHEKYPHPEAQFLWEAAGRVWDSSYAS